MQHWKQPNCISHTITFPSPLRTQLSPFVLSTKQPLIGASGQLQPPAQHYLHVRSLPMPGAGCARRGFCWSWLLEVDARGFHHPSTDVLGSESKFWEGHCCRIFCNFCLEDQALPMMWGWSFRGVAGLFVLNPAKEPRRATRRAGAARREGVAEGSGDGSACLFVRIVALLTWGAREKLSLGHDGSPHAGGCTAVVGVSPL